MMLTAKEAKEGTKTIEELIYIYVEDYLKFIEI